MAPLSARLPGWVPLKELKKLAHQLRRRCETGLSHCSRTFYSYVNGGYSGVGMVGPVALLVSFGVEAVRLCARQFLQP